MKMIQRITPEAIVTTVAFVLTLACSGIWIGRFLAERKSNTAQIKKAPKRMRLTRVPLERRWASAHTLTPKIIGCLSLRRIALFEGELPARKIKATRFNARAI